MLICNCSMWLSKPSPFIYSYKSLESSGFRLFTRFGNMDTMICSRWATGALVRSNTDDQWWGRALTQCSSSSQSCWLWLKSGLSAGNSSVLSYLALCMEAHIMFLGWNRKGLSPNSCHNIGSLLLSKISFYAVILRFPRPNVHKGMHG